MCCPHSLRGADVRRYQTVDSRKRDVVLVFGDLRWHAVSEAPPVEQVKTNWSLVSMETDLPAIMNYYTPPETNPVVLFLL